MRKLIATKSHRYDTRQLKAGDEYEATDMHARILVGIRKARYAPAPSLDRVAPVRHVETPSVVDDLDRLRIEAKRLGIEVDGRWGDIRLKHEIAQAKQPR